MTKLPAHHFQHAKSSDFRTVIFLGLPEGLLIGLFIYSLFNYFFHSASITIAITLCIIISLLYGVSTYLTSCSPAISVVNIDQHLKKERIKLEALEVDKSIINSALADEKQEWEILMEEQQQGLYPSTAKASLNAAIVALSCLFGCFYPFLLSVNFAMNFISTIVAILLTLTLVQFFYSQYVRKKSIDIILQKPFLGVVTVIMLFLISQILQ